MPNRQPKTLRQIMAENLRILRFAAHISQAEIIPALACQRLRSVCRNGAVGVYIDIASPRHRAIAAYPCICVVICIPVDLAVIPRKHTRDTVCAGQRSHLRIQLFDHIGIADAMIPKTV